MALYASRVLASASLRFQWEQALRAFGHEVAGLVLVGAGDAGCSEGSCSREDDVGKKGDAGRRR